MKKIQIRDRKGFVSQSGKLQALDVLLKTTEKSSSVVVLVEDNETLQMLDEYLRCNRSYFSHTCLLDERACNQRKSLQHCQDIILTSKKVMESMICPCLDVGVIVDFDFVCSTKREEANAIAKFCSGKISSERVQIYRFESTDKRVNAARRVLNKIHSVSSVSTTTRVSELWGDLSELLI